MIHYQGICVVCGNDFKATVKCMSARRRVTCSKRCSISLQWKNPETKKRLTASITRERHSPEGQARIAAHNKRRWAKPEEHAKLSEWNKQRWADPHIKKSLSVAIKKAQKNPVFRKLMSDIRKADWKRPEYRRKMIEGNRISHNRPEFRAQFSERLRARWADPVARQKMLDGWAKATAKKQAMLGRPLSEIELAVLDTIIDQCRGGIYLTDLRALCRDAGVSSTQIAKIIDSLIIQRKVIKMRFIPNALRVLGRGIIA